MLSCCDDAAQRLEVAEQRLISVDFRRRFSNNRDLSPRLTVRERGLNNGTV
ncbi:hypothetical protein PO124_02510 [Bacillus licheniformis]|nr:hypothetical protein [Bacillus licheniformis]